MARPMMMLGRELYEEIDELIKTGVKNEAIIREKKLSLKGPTFKNKMRLYWAYKNATGELRDRIGASLFPEWVLTCTTKVQIQDPAKWRYIDQMPYGYWEPVDPK